MSKGCEMFKSGDRPLSCCWLELLTAGHSSVSTTDSVSKPMITKELVCLVVSMDGQNHELRAVNLRNVYRTTGGKEVASFMGGRTEILRSKCGMAVIHLNYATVKSTKLF